MTTPQGKTAEEAREEFPQDLSSYVDYWSRVEEPPIEQLKGLAFSFLCLLDGVSGSGPLDLRTEDGTVINDDVMLHEIWHRHGKRP